MRHRDLALHIGLIRYKMLDWEMIGWLQKMGLPGIEPGTSRLSGARSNLLSYKPLLEGRKRVFES